MVTECTFLSLEDYYFQILMMGLRLSEGLDLNQEEYQKAYLYFQTKLKDSIIENNHLKAKNIDLLDDILLALMD